MSTISAQTINNNQEGQPITSLQINIIENHQPHPHHRNLMGIDDQRIWFERIGSILIFILVLISYVSQSELSQIIQNQNNYQKPYLLLYLTHSSYLFILPLHLLMTKLIRSRKIDLSGDFKHSIWDDLVKLKLIFMDQYRFEDLNDHQTHSLNADLDESESDESDETQGIRRNHRFENLSNSVRITSSKSNVPLQRFLIRSIQLTFLIALPSLSWFASVSLTDLTSVTAIYNTNAFFAYVFSLMFLKFELISIKKIISVLISLFGVLIITFSNPTSNMNLHASTEQDNLPNHNSPSQSTSLSTPHRLMGTTLAFVGSLTYAGYEVWYKKLISLPDPQILRHSLTLFSSKSTLSNLPEAEPHSSDQEELTGLLSSSESQVNKLKPEIDLVNRLLKVSPQIILLHANSITSSIGFFTLTLLWIPIPILHFLKFEPFELPPNTKVTFLILGMISMGVIFNAGFMVLLGLWGPVVASVGNLYLILIPNYHFNLSILIGCI
ncbi:hypothetical protein DFH28DRAFT_968633 [Melampsora americana]|nr:hypothetical protein DFH28DRAFT_968633 [Melampsora americana]